MNALKRDLMNQSERRLVTGFASAALIACELIAANATIAAAAAAITNTHQLMDILYANCCSQLLAENQATGNAIREAIITSFIKSPEINNTISFTPAPRIFLTPISLALCTVV